MAKTLGSDRHKALVEMLVKARENAGMTQTDLAEKLGEYQSFVARMESGQRRIDVIEFLELSNILGFNASQALKKIEDLPE